MEKKNEMQRTAGFALENDRFLPWQKWLCLFIGVCLLTSLGRYFASNLGGLLSTMALFPIGCAFAGILALRMGACRQWEYRLLLAILALTFLSSAINEKFYGVFRENGSYLGVLVVSIFACYLLAFALPKEKRATVLHTLIFACTAVVAIVSLVGLILMASGAYYMPRFHPEYGIGLCPPEVGLGADFRLVAFTHPNTVGMVCEITLLLAGYRWITAKKKTIKAFYALAAILCFLAIAAAASRTSSLATSLGIAMLVFRALYLRLANKKASVRWMVAIGAAVVTVLASFLLLDALYGGILQLSPMGRSETAAATEAARVIADETGAFTGRTSLWTSVWNCMCDTPRLFLCGVSPVNVGNAIAPYSTVWFQEVHSSYVQMLISCGALCPILFAAFIVLLAVRGVRRYLACPAEDALDAGWLVPAIVAILFSGCMETFLLLYHSLHFANLWFFLLAGYLVCLDTDREKARI